MNKQEAYEKIRAWLTRPGARRAYDDDWENADGSKTGLCRYEMEIDGVPQRCAVGCLLSDYDLGRSMASFAGGVIGLFEQYGVPVYLMGIGNDSPNPLGEIQVFLGKFQTVHDSQANWDGTTGEFIGVDQLDDLAREYGLTVVQ